MLNSSAVTSFGDAYHTIRMAHAQMNVIDIVTKDFILVTTNSELHRLYLIINLLHVYCTRTSNNVVLAMNAFLSRTR
jgi:hypothetical protein